MAQTEVTTVSMGDLMVMKATEEENGDDEDSNTQVILQLQPITAGMDESGETDTAVVAVEAHPETTVDGEEVELGYPITCGECKAVLLVKKFVCPGINVKCVKYEDQLISPKQFVHMSGKATLKDWKRAIRMGGVMLRKMMDSGQLDFYEHSTLCTNTCRSTKFDLLINNTRFPPDGSGLTTPISSQAQVVIGNGGQVAMTTEERSDVLTGTVEWSSGAVAMETEKKETSEISEETLNFWKGIADVGLMGEVVDNIRTELLEMLRGVQLRSEQAAMQDADSCLVEVAVLSNLAQVFGLLDSVKHILNVRREQTDPGEEQVLSTLTNLELQLEEQRRQQHVRAQLCHPQPLNNISHTPGGKPTKPKAKRPRLQRPASTTTLLTSSLSQPQTATLQPQQFTVLSPISFSSMGQPFSLSGLSGLSGLPMTTLGQQNNTVTLHTLPAGAQTFTRYITTMVGADGKMETLTLHPSQGLTLVGTTLQDPSQLGGTMMSPLELVQLTQGGVTVSGEMMVEQPMGQVVEGGTMVLHQEGMVQEGLVEGVEDKSQAQTVTEIDPAPGDQDQTMGAVMELQLAQEGEAEAGEEGSAMVVHGGMEVTMVSEEVEGEVGEGMVVQGESEDAQGEVLETGQQSQVEGIQLDANGQISGLRIMVIEEETQEEDKAK
ncbi:glucocorticoid modulatory element-binding protein 1-like isoform X2 [Coregonus clupeaformis]|uniref:glucocorticoid modulatory element-binding protein 1-like isoform X2 n=1 Tax=Coregonus clupeaformis TaxID=59861 RepID=UPI001BE100A3|nr:glucocorticoid modulatory element-binding protein 1-like isoform X2 [Coregonus clupeaformis]